MNSVCASGVKFWCIKDKQLMGPFNSHIDGKSEVQEKCSSLNASIWTPRDDISINLFDTSEMIWTGSTRFNRTHLMREDGYVFRAKVFHYEETPGLLSLSFKPRRFRRIFENIIKPFIDAT